MYGIIGRRGQFAVEVQVRAGEPGRMLLTDSAVIEEGLTWRKAEALMERLNARVAEMLAPFVGEVW